jgi:hypothetical protein
MDTENLRDEISKRIDDVPKLPWPGVCRDDSRRILVIGVSMRYRHSTRSMPKFGYAVLRFTMSSKIFLA